jgi:hypothetical protein
MRDFIFVFEFLQTQTQTHTHTHAAIHLGRKDHRTTGHVLLSPSYHCSALLAINHYEGILDLWGIALNVPPGMTEYIPSSKFIFWSSQLQCDAARRWRLWEAIRFPWGPKAVTYIMGLMPSWEEEPSQSFLSLPCEETEGRQCLQVKKLIESNLLAPWFWTC